MGYRGERDTIYGEDSQVSHLMNLKDSPHPTRFRTRMLILIASFLVLGLAACSTAENAATFYPEGTFPIDSELADFYDSLDGQNWLGPAISPLYTQDGLRCQYTVTALLCFDPEVSGITRYRLAPLGQLIDVKEDPIQEVAEDAGFSVDGYPIYPRFVPLYQKFHGLLYAGKPLTNAFYNPARNRIEQYFENLGFYHKVNGTGSSTGLIEYGQEICRDSCPDQWGNAIADLKINRNDPRTDFIFSVEFLGGAGRFGDRLTDLYIASDGNLEMVYQNAVFYAPMDDPRDVRLRPLTSILSIPTALPGEQQYGEDKGSTFYPVEEAMGYHVPIIFDEFIRKNAGTALFGLPLSDTYSTETGLPRQCFTHLCLEYDKTAREGEAVYLVAIGRQYLDTQQPETTPFSIKGAIGQAVENQTRVELKQLSFLCSERAPQVGRNAKQSITIFVFDRETHQAVPNVNASLLVTSPDGEQHSYTLPPTSADGLSSVEIDAIPHAEDGDLVTYKACIQSDGTAQTCISDAYMIWGED